MSDTMRGAIATGILGLITTVIGCFLTYYLMSKRTKSKTDKLLNSLSELGIDEFLYKWGQTDDFIRDHIQRANLIKILYTAGSSFFRLNAAFLQSALNKGAEIRVILATENSPYINETIVLEESDGIIDNINSHIATTIKSLENWRTDYPRGTISIKKFNTQFRGNIIIIDDSIAYYTPLLPPKLSSDTLTFRLKKGYVLNDCNKYFDTLFKVLS